MRVVTGAEMQNIDRFTIEQLGIPGVVLMENAGRAIAEQLLSLYETNERFLILIGSGNNGGDGFVIARVLQDMGRGVDVCVVPKEETFTGDAKLHKEIYENAGYGWSALEENQLSQMLLRVDVIVDALLDTGVSGEVREPYASLIEDVNQAGKIVVAVDLPSGVPADESPVPAGAIRANRTFTLQLPKRSYYTYPARRYYGETDVLPIGIPPLALEQVTTERRVWGANATMAHWQKRAPDSHKGQNGKVGIIAGSQAMPGAAAFVSEAAVKSGAGLTTLGTVKENLPVIASHVKEVMYAPMSHVEGALAPSREELFFLRDGKQVIAIGPGIGRSEASGEMFQVLIEHYEGPLVVDADGLHFLGEMLDKVRERKPPLIITPHTGEMAALTEKKNAEVNANRFEVAESFACDYGVYVVLKGPNTLVATPEGRTWINDSGNAGLAKGGSGDVLTGMIAAFVARGINKQIALSTAVFLHGHTADFLLAQGKTTVETLTPSEIMEGVGEAFRELHKNNDANEKP
ncbi:bifunctional ADP-dependent NAD(P)H-hydrate dehydratase/NAD(P)H-hydrate epimerase [Shouchella shacheensis]|uniref:bifunctional ADP-dependent NAD(P)H-hydrate dehydratase/NAD(P)H-hydrate epimerase n=1 Tax=Shouchella shacheensis TaxID=1649580 RepID=UPI00073FC508|nr:bifunctional ADP-dependent NAD(P)H-hydrate dehydratase/NAD(P)H-hydrate epimerase [Shouchella shacheensis]